MIRDRHINVETVGKKGQGGKDNKIQKGVSSDRNDGSRGA